VNFVELIFYPTKAILPLLLPPTGFLLLAIGALLLAKRWPRVARCTVWFACLSLLLLSLPVVSDALLGALDAAPFDSQTAPQAQVVVILGGGLQRNTPEYGDTLSTHSLARVRYGAKLAKQFALPVLVTGGQVFGGPAEAKVMAQVLQEEYGVSARWIEDRARHTAENARLSAQMLAPEHIDRVLLVTHDFHMRRALAHCSTTRLQCFPAPVSLVGHARDSWTEHLPNAGALRNSSLAIHEFLGNLAIRWR